MNNVKLKLCWEVDDNGNIVEHYFISQKEIDDMRKTGKKIVDVAWKNGLFTPKYDFVKNDWVEGMEQSKIDQIKSKVRKAPEKSYDVIDEIEQLKITVQNLITEIESLKTGNNVGNKGAKS